MNCTHCERARAGIGTGYRLHPSPCNECVARSVARSLVTFEAVRTRDVSELRETLDRMLPGLPFDLSAAMVRVWWQLDRKLRAEARLPG